MNIKDVKYIVIHCSATRSDKAYSPELLEADHRARGFRSAGYHFYVRQDGTVVPMRPLGQIGAHTRGFNRCSIGVCYEGGISPEGKPSDTRTRQQKRALRALLIDLKSLYPWAQIVGHRDLSPDRDGNGRIERWEWLKACPSFDAQVEYQDI